MAKDIGKARQALLDWRIPSAVVEAWDGEKVATYESKVPGGAFTLDLCGETVEIQGGQEANLRALLTTAGYDVGRFALDEPRPKPPALGA